MIQRILSTLLGLAFLVVVFIFASVLVAIVLTAALLLGGWMRWRGRGRVTQRRGRVVEGESRVVRDQNYHLRP
jgi:O-antigen/teichoic acid export membrane protein